MDKAGVQDAFAKAGLSRVIKDIDLLAQSSIRLFTTPAKEGALAKGASKLGGMPDLPPGFEWPQWKKLPQSFIAQIRLEDVQPSGLPGSLLAAIMLALEEAKANGLGSHDILAIGALPGGIAGRHRHCGPADIPG